MNRIPRPVAISPFRLALAPNVGPATASAQAVSTAPASERFLELGYEFDD